MSTGGSVNKSGAFNNGIVFLHRLGYNNYSFFTVIYEITKA